MEILLYAAESRGITRTECLTSTHAFSFGEYYDSKRLGFGPLRVLNDDVIAPSKGVSMHPHDNIEIISIPLSGRLKHNDSMGRTYVLDEGDVQVMSAGMGLSHSEYNDSSNDEVRFLQLWITPDVRDTEPRCRQAYFSRNGRKNVFQLIVSPQGKQGSLPIRQQAYISLLSLDAAGSQRYICHMKQANVYLFVIKGAVFVANYRLESGDGLGAMTVETLDITSHYSSDILIVEVLP